MAVRIFTYAHYYNEKKKIKVKYQKVTKNLYVTEDGNLFIKVFNGFILFSYDEHFTDNIPAKLLEESFVGKFFKFDLYIFKDVYRTIHTVRFQYVRRYLKSRELRGKTPALNKVTAEIFCNAMSDSVKEFEWGYVGKRHRGQRPMFYVPKDLHIEKIGWFYIVRNADVKTEVKEGSYGDLRDLLGGYVKPTFKFKKGKRDLVFMLANRYEKNEIKKYGIPLTYITITNGGGNGIILFDATNINVKKLYNFIK